MIKFIKKIFSRLQKKRYNYCLKLLDKNSKTLLDVGCSKGDFVELAKQRGYDAAGIDYEDNVETTTKTADIVTCFQVLEHVFNPVKAIKNLNKIYKKQLIISVPNEPIFSLLRLSTNIEAKRWYKEHLWAITPTVLKIYLGMPVFEKKILLKRYYVGVWMKHQK